MAKIQSVEPNIADLANGWLKSYKRDYKLEQESLNTEIDQALNDYYSKNGGVGGNRPDAKLLLQDKNLVNYPILIEYKGYKEMVSLPIKNNGYIDFDFMESFIAELEAERVAELSAYLTVSGLDNYELSSDEENALKNYQSLKWDTYNLEKLFGKSTRGKRLKGDDRIAGTLPFVTAGEASEGISAYISNEVEVFEKNTTTIDMFGSAKYRNYIYGGDDHIAVVHTENLPKYASIFVTTAIHKSSHNGQFDYGHNFYAKDADALYISLPVNEAGNPDYDKMAIIISAIHKLVIKDVVAYSNRKIKATKAVVK